MLFPILATLTLWNSMIFVHCVHVSDFRPCPVICFICPCPHQKVKVGAIKVVTSKCFVHMQILLWWSRKVAIAAKVTLDAKGENNSCYEEGCKYDIGAGVPSDMTKCTLGDRNMLDEWKVYLPEPANSSFTNRNASILASAKISQCMSENCKA